MYSENLRRDVGLFIRAVLTNQLAKFAFYLKVGDRSGRGPNQETPEQAAAYFRKCVLDYFEQLGLDERQAASFLHGKSVLEYGPGDTLGVALLLYARGAESVHCVDRFPIHTVSDKNLKIYAALLDSLEGEQRERANRAFNEAGNPKSGFNPTAIIYRVTPDGVSGRHSEYDLIISRSVLQLVNRLDKTMQDISGALKPGGISIHKVDLSSHGLDRYRAFDFLTWPDVLYRMMYSRKGRPNRWRVDKYQELASRCGLAFRKLIPTDRLGPQEIEVLLPALPSSFRAVAPDLLSWLGFWMVVEPVG